VIRCGSYTEVTWIATREKTKVWCRLDDSHTCDHRGSVDSVGLTLTWPRYLATAAVLRIPELVPLPAPIGSPERWNAACIWPPPYPLQDDPGPKVRIE